jgi:hypothetical protein
MGRTNPTFRDTLRQIENDWDSFRRGLRRRDHEHYDSLWKYAREHADAGGNLNHPNPTEVMLLSVCLGQQRRVAELEHRIKTIEKHLCSSTQNEEDDIITSRDFSEDEASVDWGEG